MFQLVTQLDYFKFKANNNNNNNKKNSNKTNKNKTNTSPDTWYDEASSNCLSWLKRFLIEYAKPGASRGPTTAKFARIYRIHLHFQQQPGEFGDLIENQTFSQIMAGNYQ